MKLNSIAFTTPNNSTPTMIVHVTSSTPTPPSVTPIGAVGSAFQCIFDKTNDEIYDAFMNGTKIIYQFDENINWPWLEYECETYQFVEYWCNFFMEDKDEDGEEEKYYNMKYISISHEGQSTIPILLILNESPSLDPDNISTDTERVVQFYAVDLLNVVR